MGCSIGHTGVPGSLRPPPAGTGEPLCRHSVSFQSRRAAAAGTRARARALQGWESLARGWGGAGESPRGPLCGEQPVGGTWCSQEGGPSPPWGPTTQVQLLPPGATWEAGLPGRPARSGGPPACPAAGPWSLGPRAPRQLRAPHRTAEEAGPGAGVQVPAATGLARGGAASDAGLLSGNLQRLRVQREMVPWPDRGLGAGTPFVVTRQAPRVTGLLRIGPG